MKRSELLRRLQPIKMPLLIFACTMVLLLCTERRSADKDSPLPAETDFLTDTVSAEEARLEETLQMIKGVGKAQVLLSLRMSAQTEYITDEGKTVVLSAGSGKQEALASRTRSPEYMGAVIVCEGGNDPNVQWSILEAVSRFTGLRADQITVLKLRE